MEVAGIAFISLGADGVCFVGNACFLRCWCMVSFSVGYAGVVAHVFISIAVVCFLVSYRRVGANDGSRCCLVVNSNIGGST